MSYLVCQVSYLNYPVIQWYGKLSSFTRPCAHAISSPRPCIPRAWTVDWEIKLWVAPGLSSLSQLDCWLILTFFRVFGFKLSIPNIRRSQVVFVPPIRHLPLPLRLLLPVCHPSCPHLPLESPIHLVPSYYICDPPSIFHHNEIRTHFPSQRKYNQFSLLYCSSLSLSLCTSLVFLLGSFDPLFWQPLGETLIKKPQFRAVYSLENCFFFRDVNILYYGDLIRRAY